MRSNLGGGEAGQENNGGGRGGGFCSILSLRALKGEGKGAGG